MFEIWAVIIGTLLILMAVSGAFIKRLPLTTTIFYLILGLFLGPLGIDYIVINPLDYTEILERVTEIAVIVSLFNAGLKLRRLKDKWQYPVRLAFLSMLITVALITLTGYYLLGLPLGAAVLLGAIIAPTDPVLASDVQLEHPWEEDRLKFTLTGEAGLNDGTVFPFVMLGLGLSGLHELGSFGIRWFLVDVVWAITGGLAVGALLGFSTGKIILTLRKKYKEANSRDEFIVIGLISLSYGVALLINTYGFLSVFAAGLAFVKSDTMEKPFKIKKADVQEREDTLTKSVLIFNGQLEHILEIAVVLIIGAILTYGYLPVEAYWFIPLLFLVIRPVSVFAGLSGLKIRLFEKSLYSWFGIRGIGSIYYLMYAIGYGLPRELSHKLITYTLIVIVVSIVIHGISVTPLMRLYDNKYKSG
ncbi:MAG: cation:proton antiporter [Ignavibacteriaceae bacterium]